MRKFTFFIFFVVSIYSLWPGRGVILAQQNAPDEELLNNIEIMETVLDKLMTPEKSRMHFFGNDTKGYYLMNYGIIFNVSYSIFSRRLISIDLDSRFMESDYFVVNEKTGKRSEKFEKKMDQLKNTLARFLGEWTSALATMKPDEKVAIIVDFNRLSLNFPASNAFSPQQLIASVPIREITNYRRGKLSRDQFKDKIIFDEVKSTDEEIAIVSNVIETSLGHVGKKKNFNWSGNVKGVYFKGYGVIFFTDLSYGSIAFKNAFTKYSRALKKSKGRTITFESISNQSGNQQKGVEELEQKLIRIVSNYGHNLSILQPDEWVEIAVNFRGMPAKGNYSKSVLKVQKKIIDDFNKERITYDQFKKQVRVIYY